MARSLSKGNVIPVSLYEHVPQVGRHAADQRGGLVAIEFRRSEPLLEGLEQLVDVMPIVPGQEQSRSASPHSPVHGLVFSGPHDVVLMLPRRQMIQAISGSPGLFEFDLSDCWWQRM